MHSVVIVPDHMRLHILSLMLEESAFFNPSDRLPSFELDEKLVCIDWLRQVEIDVTLDGVSCEVKRLVELNESV